jgi:hypothetical protein
VSIKISDLTAAAAVDLDLAESLFPVVVEADTPDGTKALPSGELAKFVIGRIAWNEVPTGSINGSNVTFTLAAAPLSARLLLFRSGLCMKPGAGHDYTLSGATITFATAPETGENLLAFYHH